MIIKENLREMFFILKNDNDQDVFFNTNKKVSFFIGYKQP